MADSNRTLNGLGVAPTLATLNEDILLQVFLALTSRQLLSLMSVSSRLFHTGLPTLLSRSHNPSGSQLRSFHRFLSFYAPESYSFLRELHFTDGSGITTHELVIVAYIIKHATNLQVLEIACEAFERCEPVATAIISLTGLRDICLTFEDVEISHSVLTHLKAPLVRLNLQIDESPLPLLGNFCDTLEEVHLQYLDLPDVPFSCPKVTRLFLWHCDEPLLSVLTTVFPNLEVLSINSGYSGTPRGVQQYEELRTRNTALQPHSRLPSLVSLTVDEVAMYTMNLQDEVDSLICPSPFRFSEAYECDPLRTSLQSLRPRHLQLACLEYTTSLAKALSAGVERLDRLDLLVESGNAPFHAISDGILNALKSLRIRMLSCEFTRDEPMDFIHAEGLAQGALMLAPTLAYIHVTICDNSYWTVVVEEEGGKQLRRVQSESEISRIKQMFLPPQIQHDYQMESW